MTAPIAALAGLALENPCLFRARLSGRFLDERDYGCHGGLDLTYRNAKDGLYLRPAYPGRFEFSGFKNDGLGNRVVMSHTFNGVRFLTWYCHLEAMYLPAWWNGDTIVMLGIAGATGNVYPVGSQGRHLHFALQVPGIETECGLVGVIDPLPYFAADVVADWTKKR